MKDVHEDPTVRGTTVVAAKPVMHWKTTEFAAVVVAALGTILIAAGIISKVTWEIIVYPALMLAISRAWSKFNPHGKA